MFEQTSTRSELTLRYSVEGAPTLITGLDKKKAKPVSVNFVFLDGEFYGVKVFAYRYKANGDLTGRVTEVNDIYSYDQKNWPEWLVELSDKAFDDFKSGYRVDA